MNNPTVAAAKTCKTSVIVLAAFLLNAAASARADVCFIGNSLTRDCRAQDLSDFGGWHLLNSGNLPHIFANPNEVLAGTTPWPELLASGRCNVLVVQPHLDITQDYRSPLDDNVSAIDHWMQLVPNAKIVIYTGWSFADLVREHYESNDEANPFVHSPIYYEQLLSRLRILNPEREIIRTHHVDLIYQIMLDAENGIAPFADISNLYRDAIHLDLVVGRYFAHNLLRAALGRGITTAGFEDENGGLLFPAEVKAYLDQKIVSVSSLEDASLHNVVNIVFDDADFFDFGFNNRLTQTPDVLTPNIDQLRREGRLMTQYYAASAVCSPTRASLLTGQSPLQHGAVDAWASLRTVVQSEPGMNGLPTLSSNLGVVLQNLGCETGHFGKWHVGYHRTQFRPQNLGWMHHLTHIVGPDETIDTWDGEFTFYDGQSTDRRDVEFVDSHYADQVRQFIAESAADGNRFAINYWPLSPHRPWAAPRDFDNSETQFDLTTNRGKLLAMMYRVDQEIGRIRQQLIDLGLSRNTLILVSSDNGGQKSVQHPEHLRGSKSTLFEGGIRVPLVAHWPGKIPAGTQNSTVITSYDLLATLVELFDAEPAELLPFIDGRSKAQALLADETLAHDPILWQLSGSAIRRNDERAQRTFAYRDGDLKVIKIRGFNDLTNSRAFALYDLADDPFETTNLSRSLPALTQQMSREMLQLRASQSRYFDLAETYSEAQTFRFDPRMDVTSKDMTVSMELSVLPSTSGGRNIFYRPGAMQLWLDSQRRLRWRILGAKETGQRSLNLLTSQPLDLGSHRIVMRITGWKLDSLRAELFVDGIKEMDLDADAPNHNVVAVRTSTRDTTIGSVGLLIEDFRYYNTIFYLDELAQIE